MPQETNLNVSPYFDDFDIDKDYYKVLFKPGYPIQARELTSLQSILQNQVEQYGKHIFKEGSVVIPGDIRYLNPVYCVEIEDSFNGASVSLYFDQFLGKKLRGSNSGVTAEVVYLLKNTDSERGSYTLYLKYLTSGGEDFTNRIFESGETLILETPLTYGNFTIQAGQGACNTISTNATSEGTAISVSEGIYFVRGTFARVEEQTILLDQYSIFPSYKIGFDIIEEVVTSDQDEGLFDNAQGFSNYAAPGADRFKITLELSKRNIDDSETNNFVEVLRVQQGELQFFDTNTQYNLIRDELARRTFDESGNYFVRPFSLFVRDSLNDKVLNRGIYFKNQRTVQGNNPSEDLMVYQIGPGKAYVNGYDVETISPRLIDVPKTRTTSIAENQVIPYNAGTSVIVNNTYGFPSIGLGTNTTISLMDSRIGESPSVATGTTIGLARIYDCVPESSYIDDKSRFNLRLFDIQTYTKIGLTTSFGGSGLSTPCFIEGKKSKATGYLKDSITASDSILTLYETTGDFLENEQIIVNGIENGRLIRSVEEYSISDVKSIHYKVGINTFNADLELPIRSYIANPGTIFRVNDGVVSAGLANVFTNTIKVGDLVSYANTSFSGDPIYNKVTAIGSGGTSFTVTGITTVNGICDGVLPSGSFEVTNILKITPSIDSTNSSFLTLLNAPFVSSVSLQGNEIIQRRSYNVASFSGNLIEIQIEPTDTDIFFDSFDEDRFIITYSDGSVEPLRSDQYNISLDGKTLTFNGLSKSSGTNAIVVATVRNINPSFKSKKLNKVSSLVVSNSTSVNSGIGTTTLNDGLTYSNVYGTRVQDKIISLNVPDVIRVLAVYESNTLLEPDLPTLIISGNSNGNQNYVIGEQIEGKTSGAVGIIVNKKDSDKLEFVYLNELRFSLGETVLGEDSLEESIVSSKITGDINITQNYLFDDGQRDTFYDYSRIIRKKDIQEPTKKLKIIFQNYTIDPSDTGEFISVNSYGSDNFKYNVPFYRSSRLTDYIDIRPRVAPYTLSSKSPFEFSARNFASDGQYSKYILCPGENLILSYSYYLGRIDRVFLNNDGTFDVSRGIPSSNPTPPPLKANLLDIATIFIPPYVFNTESVAVDMSKHKRYRMEDISLLEDRIQRVEKYTTLSMLESKTENFIIKDAETGLDRFKCGFFVDNFSSNIYNDSRNPSFRSIVDTTSNTLRPLEYSTSIDLQLGSEIIAGVGQTFNPFVDQSYVTDLGSPNIKKTGDLITLNYNEVLYDEQIFATKTESVTPFIVAFWQGTITLSPPIDTWIDERYFTTNNINESVVRINRDDENITTESTVNVEENIYSEKPKSQFGLSYNLLNLLIPLPVYTELFPNYQVGVGRRPGGVYKAGWPGNYTYYDPSTMFGRVSKDIFGNTIKTTPFSYYPPGWSVDYVGIPKPITTLSNLFSLGAFVNVSLNSNDKNIKSETTTKTESNISTTIVPEEIVTTESTSDSISNYTEVIKYLRSRNIEFDAKSLKPVTRFYSFFEGIDVSNYIIPKLLEIEMISGKFIIGEDVESDPHFTAQKIRFRVCKPNHRTGPYDGSNPPTITNPSPIVDIETGQLIPQNPDLLPKLDVYKFNPYTQQLMPDDYSESSTVLNVDTRALELASETSYYGMIAPNMKLIGKASGAVARITNIRLISDNSGRLIGSLYIPDPNIPSNPRWVNGESTFTLVDTPSLDNLSNTFQDSTTNSRVSESSAETGFSSFGISNVKETNITTTRNVRILSAYNVNVNNVVTTNTTTNIIPTQQSSPGLNIPLTNELNLNINTSLTPQFTNLSAIQELFNLGSSLVNQTSSSGSGGSPFGSGGSPFGSGGSPFGSGETPFGSGVFAFRGVPLERVGPFSIKQEPASLFNGRVLLPVEPISLFNGRVILPQLCIKDPLAQSFYVNDSTGIFLTSVEVFFETKDEATPVTLQIRPLDAGVPSTVVVPFSEVTLDPDSVGLSTDGTVPTKFIFPSPVYLSGPTEVNVRRSPIASITTSEYAIVLLSNSPQYKVFISELGQNDIITGTKISAQPTLGSLFKSQNGSVWTPSQLEDLKYKIYRADFVNEGLVRFFNPKLDIGNNNLTVTDSNQFLPLSKRIIVGLGSTGYDTSEVVPGVTLQQGTSTGKLIGIAGSISSGVGIGVSVDNPGFGYTVGTFTGISLETETGSGRGAVATIGVTTVSTSEGSVVGIATVTITNGGFGYQVGDSLSLPEVGLGQNVGFGGKLTVVSIDSNNTFIIDNVQGKFNVGITTLNYINSSGIVTQTGAGVTISNIFEDPYYDGLHMKVNHINHGMHSTENYMIINSFRPLLNEVKSRTTSVIQKTDTTIPIVSSVGFETFEGLPVDGNNPGYVVIGNEIIQYTSYTATSLTSVTRAFETIQLDSPQAQTYESGVPVYKYEFNGISLRRINKIHNFAEVDVQEHPINLDSYFIKIDTSDQDFDNKNIGVDRSDNLYFKETKQTGNSGTILTNNIQFESITPNVLNIIPPKTNLASRIRTFTGTSISGNEKSFVDNGFEIIPLNSTVIFDTPRLICSEINEQKFITESPGNKSLTMEFLMSTIDPKVSPVIDTIGVSAILSSNLINSPNGVNENSNYENDDSVRSLFDDKHSTIYISKPTRLKIPANSLKVLLTASRDETNDIRVLYQIFRDDAPQASKNYELFPGYSNYQIDGQGIKRVIDPSLNDGSADSFVKQSDRSFKDYEYSVDDLPEFSAFAIKIIMAGTNQARPPFIKQLRAIATIKPRI